MFLCLTPRCSCIGFDYRSCRQTDLRTLQHFDLPVVVLARLERLEPSLCRNRIESFCWSMTCYGTKTFSETGLFGRLEVVKFAFKTIRNNSREQLIHSEGRLVYNYSLALLEGKRHYTFEPCLRQFPTQQDVINFEGLLKPTKVCHLPSKAAIHQVPFQIYFFPHLYQQAWCYFNIFLQVTWIMQKNQQQSLQKYHTYQAILLHQMLFAKEQTMLAGK